MSSAPPEEEIQYYGKNDAEYDAGGNREVKRTVFTFNADIAWQPAQPRDARTVCYKQSGYYHDDTGYD